MPRLVILDINGVLLCRHYTRVNGRGRKNAKCYSPTPNSTPYEHLHTDEFEIYLRPGMRDFLDKLFKTFRVAIWTSMQSATVESFIDQIVDRSRLEFLWCRDRCLWPEVPEGHMTLKPLEMVWRNPVINDKYAWNETNVLIVDNDLTKMRYNPSGNVVLIRSFSLKTPGLETDLDQMHQILKDRFDELSLTS